MEEITLFDSELKVMNIIWEEEMTTAKDISLVAAERYGWNKNTTYTVIKKLIKKDVIRREEPNFQCIALVSKENIQIKETKKLVKKLYEGSAKLFLSTFIEKEELSEEELKSLRDMIDKKL